MAKEPDSSTKTVAVIDFGSNSVRMVVAQVPAKGPVEVLERVQRPAQLGHDTFSTGRLSRPTMNGVLAVLRDYRRIMESYSVQLIRAVATSSVREAANSDAFLDRLETAIGLDVEVIDTSEESRLTVSAVLDSLGRSTDIRNQDTLIVEMGGGSALLTILHRGKITGSESYRMGAIRLQEALPTAHETPRRAADMLSHQIETMVNGIARLHHLKKITALVAIGGDARFAAHHVGKNVAGRKDLWAVSRKDLAGLIERCASHSTEELSRLHGLPFTDAQTLTPALLGYCALLKATQARKMIVSPVSMRDGLIMDVARILHGQQDLNLNESILASARSLGEKYNYDAAHAKHVVELSLALFDALRGEHGLTAHHRLLLEVAGILHEVGGFVSNRSHHKHSFYLINNSVIYGLRRDDVTLVAHIARYHRRSIPRSTHLEYVALSRENRMVINKLAALLRVADALDRGHSQQVRDIQIERQGEEVIVYVPGVSDLALERQALSAKGDLFEETYGLTIRLEEAGAPTAPARRAEAME